MSFDMTGAQRGIHVNSNAGRRTIRRRTAKVSGAVPVLLALLVFARSAAGSQEVPCRKARELADRLGRSVVNVQLVGRDQAGNRIAEASFSGFFLTQPRGHVLACCPGLAKLLEAGKRRLLVTFDDLRHCAGRLVGQDVETGVCLLRCEGAGGLPPGIALSQKARLRRGICVLTVANPYGLDHSVRYGFALGPTLCGKNRRCLAFRLDLESVRGHEGAVAYAFGEGFAGVVLPGSASASGSLPEGAFAEAQSRQALLLPAKAVNWIVKALAAGRPVQRGWVGLQLAISTHRDLTPRPTVKSVMPGSPAERAGLRAGWAIRSVNGKVFKDLQELYELGLQVEYEGIGKDLVLQVETETGEVRTCRIKVAPDTQAGLSAR